MRRDKKARIQMKIDFRFAEIFYELWALEEILEVIREDSESLKQRIVDRKDPEIDRSLLLGDRGDYEIVMQELGELVDRILPRHFSSPFVVSTWGVFESCVGLTASLVRDTIGVRLKLNDIRGSFLERTKRYYADVLGRPFVLEEAEWAKLRDFYLVRNAMAHTNGNTRFIKPDVLQGITELADRAEEVEIQYGHVTVTDSFLSNSFTLVKGCVEKLVQDAKNATKDA